MLISAPQGGDSKTDGIVQPAALRTT
jgi:hypothetical protein